MVISIPSKIFPSPKALPRRPSQPLAQRLCVRKRCQPRQPNHIPTSKVIVPRRVSQSRSPNLGRSSPDCEGRLAFDGPIPFPRTFSASGDKSKQNSTTSGPAVTADVGKSLTVEKPKLVRGRFQSENDSSSLRRKPRPISHDGVESEPWAIEIQFCDGFLTGTHRGIT